MPIGNTPLCHNGHSLHDANRMPSGRCRECAKIAQRKARAKSAPDSVESRLATVESALRPTPPPMVGINHVTRSTVWGYFDELEVRVNGRLIAIGTFGGEPEDNSPGRQYAWVTPLIRDLVAAFGGAVMESEETREE